MRKRLKSFFLLVFLGGIIALSTLASGCRGVEPTPSPTSTPTPSPTPTPEGAIYRNANYGFSIAYPEEWVEQETGERAPLVVIYGPAGLPVVQIFLEYLPEVTTPAEYASQVKESLEEAIPQFELVSEGEITVGEDTSAYELVFTGISEEGGPFKAKMAFVLRGTQAFTLYALSTTANFDRREETIDQIVSNFQLEEPSPFGVPRSEALTLFDIGPITLDPAIAQESRSHLYINQIFSGLVALDEDLEVVPDIAERWEVSQDDKTYTFYLRQGVRFHSGREVKASDFKYSLERATDPQTESKTAETFLGDIVGVKEKLAGEAEEISGVRVVEDYTLEIEIDAPKAYFLSKLTHRIGYVVNRRNVESGEEWFKSPDGTGPFKLKEWVEDELIILERYDAYYGEPAKTGYVVFRLWGGVPMRMYETGEIDVTYVSTGDIERVTDPANPLSQELVIVPELSISYIGFNTAEPPFHDPKVRQAFVHALDMDRIIDLVLKGIVERSHGVLPPGMPGYNESLQGLTYDVGKARQLIAESTYGDVSNLPPLTFTAPGRGGAVSDLMTAIISQWRENLEVEVQVRQLEPESYYYVLKEEKDNLFDYAWGADYPDPQNFLDILFHSGTENNAGEYSNPQADDLLERARVEQNEERRLEMYQEAEQILVNDAALLPLWFNKSYVLVKPHVEGYSINPLGMPSLRTVSLISP